MTAELMTAARLHAVGDVRISREAAPVPAPGEDLVRVDCVGICGSDLHWFGEGSIGDARLDSPLVLGHEMGGTIVSGPRAGTRVAIDPAIPCWNCALCHAGHPNLCLHVRFAGHGRNDGGMRQYLCWPADRLHPVPAEISDEAIAVLEPLGVALHALDLAHLKIGARVGIVGCGPIGVLAVQLSRLSGAATVLAVEPLAHRRDLAAAYGAIAVTPDQAVVRAMELTAGLGLDAVVEIAGTADAIELAVDLARPGGRVVLAGIPTDDRTTFTASTARRKGLTIALSRRMTELYPRAIELVASGRIEADALVSHGFDITDVAEAFATAAGRSGHKVIVRPWSGS
jgi:L-iditol 2-dehydrogenase